MQPKNRDGLHSLVEMHERTWGTKQYRGRPKLTEILDAQVVVFWRALDDKEDRWIITLHEDLTQLERYFSRMLFRAGVELPGCRVAKIFKDGKPVIVRGVKVWFQEMEA